MIAAHLPVLQIVLLLLAAPVCMLLRGRTAWLLTLVASGWALWAAAWMLTRVLAEGTLTYALGGWAAPWGIEYRVDTANAYVLLLVAAMGALVALFAGPSLERELPDEQHALFYTAYLLCLAGLLGITITGDAFNVFVFLEISSLATYTLISLGNDRRALTAAYRYLIMGTLGATFILIGIGLLYALTGTLNMADLAERLPAVAETRTVRAAYAFLVVGISLKLALFPLHLWLPNAYAYAPSAATALLAATATKVAVYMLMRIVFTVFGPAYSFEVMELENLLLPLALAGILITSTTAIFQENVKKILAYSSIAQVGYMILGVSYGTALGLTAALLHLFNHALMKGALYLVLGCVVYRLDSVQIRHLAGMGRAMPWTMAALVVGGMSVIGVPLTAGFISKWYLIAGALERGWWPVAVMVLLSSLLAVVYVWRVVEVAYFQPLPTDRPVPQEAPLRLLLPTWLLAGANLYFGLDTRLTVGIAEQAARGLLGGG